jgi:hypothetical protein
LPPENSPAVKPEAAPAATAPAPPEPADQKAQAKAALDRAKKELAQLERDLDVIERKAALDRDAFYSKGDFQSDKQGKANLDALNQQIEAKRQDVAAQKERVRELETAAGPAQETPQDQSKTPQP